MQLVATRELDATNACTLLIGQDEFNVPAGQRLVIETSPGGEDILAEMCPAGKVWICECTVKIREECV